MNLVILKLLYIKSSSACGPAEYRIDDECCPMCSPGQRVYKHCTEYTSTSCVPCIGPTYLDEPNGLPVCKPCTHCDPGFGLMVKHPCRPSSDTVCEPLEGFYCTEPTKDGCKAAQRHSRCEPGQYIRQKGSPSTDTVCTNCTGDTYSDGSFTSCQPHTQCDTLKRLQIKPGTHWSDSECGPQTSPPIGLILLVLLGPLALAVVIIRVWTSLETCCIQACFKSSNIIPVPKKSRIKGPNYYRSSDRHLSALCCPTSRPSLTLF
uniref:TNFR-Cys domain-containing protein n=1 Tax=Esox lucius TaxID=8010 RepID=A0AAY5L8J6_ESOLU